MLVLLRILFGAALLYELVQGARSAPGAMGAGDTTPAFYLGVFVVLAILNALVWAPYFGDKVSGPLAAMITEGTYVERINFVLRFIRWLEWRGYRRAVVAFCFWEGVRHPKLPAAFVMGLRNARPGSWIEKVYAREVFRFHNTQNCVQAYLALKRHGIDPRPHPNPEVNIILLSMERPPRPEAGTVPVPLAAKPAALRRNPRIRLFKKDGVQPEEESQGSERPPLETEKTSDSISPKEGSQERSDPGEVPEAEPQARGGWCASLLARVAAFIRAH